MNNRTIENIRNNFNNISKIFDGVEGEELIYQQLKELATQELTPIEMLKKLRHISETKTFDPPLNNFFYHTYEQLKSLAKQQEKKEELTKELNQKHDEFQQIVADKGLKPKDVEELKTPYKDNSNYHTMEKTNDELQNDIDLQNKRIEELKGIRKTGEPLEEIPTENYQEISGIQEGYYGNPNNTINEMNSEFIDINKQMMKTTEFRDITREDMYNIYTAMEDKQTAEALLNVNINYNFDNVIVTLALEGTNIDETMGKTVCYFSDIEEFNKKILPILLNEHTKDGIDEEATLDENNDLESYNTYDEKLSISGNNEISSETAQKLNDSMKKQKNNNAIRVRKLEGPNSQGYNEINIYITIIILLVLITIASFIYVVAFKK